MNLDRSARRSRKAGLRLQRDCARRHHPDFDKLATQGWKALEAEGRLSEQGWRKEQQWALDMGLPGAESLVDRRSPPSRAASCRILPASTRFSKRPTSRTCAM